MEDSLRDQKINARSSKKRTSFLQEAEDMTWLSIYNTALAWSFQKRPENLEHYIFKPAQTVADAGGLKTEQLS